MYYEVDYEPILKLTVSQANKMAKYSAAFYRGRNEAEPTWKHVA